MGVERKSRKRAEEKVAELVAELRRVNSEPSGGSSELADLLEKQTLGHHKTQKELEIVKKELHRTKERLGKLSQNNVDLERAAQASKDSAEHHKGLSTDAIDELTRAKQSFEDQLAARDEEKALRDAQFDEVTTKCRGVEQQLQGAEGRCRNMALNVKQMQEIKCKAEERARESEALCKALAEKLQRAEEGAAVASEVVVQVAVSTQTAMVEEVKESTLDPQEAVQGSDQLLFGTIRHDAIWGTFPDDGYERKLLYTFMRRGSSHSSICRDFRAVSIISRTQDERVDYWRRHGWVVDDYIRNSPQIVMKRRVGYVDAKPELVRAIWASAPGC